MPAAINSLANELLQIEATGDRDRAEKWFAKYDKMPSDLKQALDAITDIPVDVFPEYSWPVTVK
jgi:ABC-type Fe3+-hydroxamate transport system substrate-binding protein